MLLYSLFIPFSFGKDSLVFFLFAGLILLAFGALGRVSLQNVIKRNRYFRKMQTIKNGTFENITAFLGGLKPVAALNISHATPALRKQLLQATERIIASEQDGSIILADAFPITNQAILLLLRMKRDVPYIPNGGETFSVTQINYHFAVVNIIPEEPALVLHIEPEFFDGRYDLAYREEFARTGLTFIHYLYHIAVEPLQTPV